MLVNENKYEKTFEMRELISRLWKCLFATGFLINKVGGVVDPQLLI